MQFFLLKFSKKTEQFVESSDVEKNKCKINAQSLYDHEGSPKEKIN